MGGLFVLLLVVGTLKALPQYFAMRKVSVIDLSSPHLTGLGLAEVSAKNREGAAGLMGVLHNAQAKTSDATLPSSAEALEP